MDAWSAVRVEELLYYLKSTLTNIDLVEQTLLYSNVDTCDGHVRCYSSDASSAEHVLQQWMMQGVLVLLWWWMCDEDELRMDLLEEGDDMATSAWSDLRVEDNDISHLLVYQIWKCKTLILASWLSRTWLFGWVISSSNYVWALTNINVGYVMIIHGY